MTHLRLATRTAITCFGLACLAIVLCGIGLNAPRAQAQDLGPAAAPDCTINVTATASCVSGLVVLNWTADSINHETAKVSVSYMSLSDGPYELNSSNGYKGSWNLATGASSEPAGTATFTLQYKSGYTWHNLPNQTKSVAALSCNTPTAVDLQTFTASSGAWSNFMAQVRHFLGTAR